MSSAALARCASCARAATTATSSSLSRVGARQWSSNVYAAGRARVVTPLAVWPGSALDTAAMADGHVVAATWAAPVRLAARPAPWAFCSALPRAQYSTTQRLYQQAGDGADADTEAAEAAADAAADGDDAAGAGADGDAAAAAAAAAAGDGAAAGEGGASEDGADADAGESLEAKVAACEEQVKELTATRLRLLAEMENVRSIARRDVDTARVYAIQSFAKAILTVHDNLERAVASVPETARDGSNQHLDSLYEGVAMTVTELDKVFASNGIEKFGAVGDEFDPHKHNALFEAPIPDVESGRVGQVLKTGFTFRDRVLRPADVGTAV